MFRSMALQRIGQNEPLDESAKQFLLKLGKPVDPQAAKPRTNVAFPCRPLTLEEAKAIVVRKRGTLLLEAPWDDALLPELAAVAKEAEHYRHATILYAALDDRDTAKEMYAAYLDHPDGTYPDAAAYAVGEYVPFENSPVLDWLPLILRFRNIANQVARDRELLIERLPSLYPDPDHYLEQQQTIWTPTLRALALLLDPRPDEEAERVIADALTEVAAHRTSLDFSYVFNSKAASLQTLFQIAMFRGLGLSASRVAKKMGKWKKEPYVLKVAGLYARKGDLMGAYEVVKSMKPPRSEYAFDELVQVLHESGLGDA